MLLNWRRKKLDQLYIYLIALHDDHLIWTPWSFKFNKCKHHKRFPLLFLMHWMTTHWKYKAMKKYPWIKNFSKNWNFETAPFFHSKCKMTCSSVWFNFRMFESWISMSIQPQNVVIPELLCSYNSASKIWYIHSKLLLHQSPHCDYMVTGPWQYR